MLRAIIVLYLCVLVSSVPIKTGPFCNRYDSDCAQPYGPNVVGQATEVVDRAVAGTAAYLLGSFKGYQYEASKYTGIGDAEQIRREGKKHIEDSANAWDFGKQPITPEPLPLPTPMPGPKPKTP